MLSFTSGTQIAKINNNKNKKKIFITNKETDEPDILIDEKDLLKLISDDDYDTLMDTNIISQIECHFIRDNIKEHEQFNSHFKGLLKKLLKIAKKKLKYEINFDSHTNMFPIIDNNSHCNYFISGASDAGKTYFMKQLLLDESKRQIYYLSPKEYSNMVDQSLVEIYEKDNFNHIIINVVSDINKMPSFKELHGSICVFDDLDTLRRNSRRSNELYQYVLDYRDRILTRGRHSNISTIVLSHSTRNHKETFVPQKECNIHVYFPRTNKFVYDRYFRDQYQFPKSVRDKITKESYRSRWLLIKLAFPSYIMTSHYLKLI
jgi:hypothetical protein